MPNHALGLKVFFRVLVPAAIALLAGCLSGAARHDAATVLEPVAFSDTQWTGLAVSKDGRLFVNYPRWSDKVPVSVAEIVAGTPVPYPDPQMNGWHSPDQDPAMHFVCVQAFFVDDLNRLWILDPANPGFKGVVPGGPKLLQVDLALNEVVRTYRFGSGVVRKNSYLNDVRVDTRRDFAFVTDSGDGALVVLDLKSGRARRVLDGHPSTEAEYVVLTIGGQNWMLNGVPPRVHADGIAYNARTDMVFYQALTGRTMHRISGAALRQLDLNEKGIAAQVETVGPTGASDGLISGPEGRIYISAIEQDAILRTSPQGRVETVIQDKAIAWPDAFSFGPDGRLYFTTSRIHEGAAPREPYGIYRITLVP